MANGNVRSNQDEQNRGDDQRVNLAGFDPRRDAWVKLRYGIQLKFPVSEGCRMYYGLCALYKALQGPVTLNVMLIAIQQTA